ncbi:MAG: PEP-CTERM system histidine kinase PrsK, partial [Sphingomonas sp.]
MIATLTLWTHALAALLFGALALWAWQRKEGGVPRRPLAFALAMTALWALSVAGIGGAETGTRIAEALRNLSWLGFMILLHRRDGNVRPPVALGTVYGVVALVSVASVILHIVGASEGVASNDILTAALLLRMLVAVAALVLIRALYSAIEGAGVGLRWIVLAMGGLWFLDFNVLAAAYLTASWPLELIALRGFGAIVLAAAMAAALNRKDDWNVQVSRTVAYQSMSLVAVGAYFALLALVSSAIATIGG